MFPSNVFDDVCPDYEYQNFDGLDVFVFKFENGYGACVSKPEGLYRSKINIWQLTPTMLDCDRWVIDITNPAVHGVLVDLVEVDIPAILNKLKTL